MEAIRRMFSPEFRNRLDAIVQFNGLDPRTVRQVVDKFLGELIAQLRDKNVTLKLDEGARNWLAEHGYDPKMGARPMDRLIQETIRKPLAEELLFGRLVNGGEVVVREEGDKLQFHYSDELAAAL
jgi:ATP-dependent Clp protease ATP-binding subunit ClpA